MAAPRSQRIAIWLIAIVLAVGTIGSFFVLIVANKNEEEKEARMSRELQEFQEASQKAEDEWLGRLSDEYHKQFSAYKSHVDKFNSTSVKELRTKDLAEGGGEKIKEGSSYYAYYIGWNPRGVVFDSSFSEDGKTLNKPLDGSMGLIEGWEKGVIGMREGGVRELAIPADQAYGKEGQGEDIPPNTPLKFIIMIIKDPGSPDTPEPSEELLKYYMMNMNNGMM